MFIVALANGSLLSSDEAYLSMNNRVVQDKGILTENFLAEGPTGVNIDFTFGIDYYDPDFWGE